MNVLAFDGRMGASGDMLLGALIAVGADPDVLSPVEEALAVRYTIDTTTKNGIAAIDVSVLLSGGDETDESSLEGTDHDGHEHGSDAGNDHEHGNGHEHSHDHEHDSDEPVHAEGHGPHRTYPEVVEIVESMDLPPGVEADAKATFEVLAEAEAAVHGTDVSETHFHEVGADDAIADVVGVALLIDDLGADRVLTAPVSAGGGTVEMSHGTYPVPAPAVVEITARADWRVAGGPIDAELLIPTGAAILAHFAEGVETLPPVRTSRVGYGAGGWDFPDRPNVLRALTGEQEGTLVRDDVAVLETNLDDAPPEVLGGLQERLVDAGARDVSIVPLTMKKSRPGHLVKVITKPADAERVARRLAEETGTLGVRQTSASHRWIAHRSFETVEVEIDGERHEIRVKIASDTDDAVYDVSAEYDDAAAVAAATGQPIREIMRRAESAVHRS